MKTLLDPRIELYQKLINSSEFKDSHSAAKLQSIIRKFMRIEKPVDIRENASLRGIKRSHKCFKCAQETPNHRCQEFFCNECGLVGHVVRECKWRGKSTNMYNAEYCELCKVRGHTASLCILRGYISKSDAQKIRCFICKSYGHARCD